MESQGAGSCCPTGNTQNRVGGGTHTTRSRAGGYTSVMHLDETVCAPQGSPHLPQACNTTLGGGGGSGEQVPALPASTPHLSPCVPGTRRPPHGRRNRNAPETWQTPPRAQPQPPAELHRTLSWRQLSRHVTAGAGAGRRGRGNVGGAAPHFRFLRTAMAELRPTGPAAPPGGPGGTRAAVPRGAPSVPPTGPGTPRDAGPTPQPAPQPPLAPQTTPEPGPTQAPLDDTRFMIASTNWY